MTGRLNGFFQEFRVCGIWRLQSPPNPTYLAFQKNLTRLVWRDRSGINVINFLPNLMTFLRSFTLTLLCVLLLAGAFAGGYLLRTRQETPGSFPVLLEAYSLLEQHGLKGLPPVRELEYGMIRGMVQAYDDPYTIFVDPPRHELESNTLEGSFGGIGTGLEMDSEGYWVLYPFPDSPAREAGLQDGDRLLAVDGQEIPASTPLETVQAAIRGPVGTRVRLTVGRAPGYAALDVTIKRAEIPLPSVTWHLDLERPTLGVIEVNLIAASTADEIQRAAEDLQGQGATHLILDLRDNPGGLLTAGVDIARLFLSQGVVIEQQYRGKDVETFRVERPGPLAEVPLAVLINHSSASAAEIIAGALKAQGRAIIVGEPSYGKDSIQLIFDLQDQSSLHVTAARWWVPGLEPPIGGNGVQPDIAAAPGDDPNRPDPVVAAAGRALLGQPE